MSQLGAVLSLAGVCACIPTGPASRTHAKQIKERIGVFMAVSTPIETLEIAPKLEQGRNGCKQFVTARGLEG
jgi:hypothetical protein